MLKTGFPFPLLNLLFSPWGEGVALGDIMVPRKSHFLYFKLNDVFCIINLHSMTSGEGQAMVGGLVEALEQ